MAAKESGSPTSATMMSTSDLNSGLPAHKMSVIYLSDVKLYTYIDVNDQSANYKTVINCALS